MLLNIFDAVEHSTVAEAVSNPLLLVGVGVCHLIGLALLGGSVLIMDLRLLGVGFKSQPVRDVFDSTRPILHIALALMFISGVPLALQEMTKLYYNFSFWVKATALLVVLVFTLTIKHPLIKKTELPRYIAICLGFTSIVLWFTVAGAGRWIGFS